MRTYPTPGYWPQVTELRHFIVAYDHLREGWRWYAILHSCQGTEVSGAAADHMELVAWKMRGHDLNDYEYHEEILSSVDPAKSKSHYAKLLDRLASAHLPMSALSRNLAASLDSLRSRVLDRLP